MNPPKILTLHYYQIFQSLISKFVRDVEQLPPSGISLDSCQYRISVSKNNDTTFVTFKGEGLNSYGDSKLTGSDGFQQSIPKSLYRSLKDKRDLICQDYGTLLEECGSNYSGVKRNNRKWSGWERDPVFRRLMEKQKQFWEEF